MNTVTATESAATVEVYGALKIERSTNRKGQPCLSLIRGKAIKPFGSFYFGNEAAREAYIVKAKADQDTRDAYKAECVARDAREKIEGQAMFQVGDLLAYSWGYDQTNVEFFQVVERKAATVKIARIASQVVKPGFDSQASCTVAAVPGAFIAGKEVLTKKINGLSLKMDHGIAKICAAGETFHSSSYA